MLPTCQKTRHLVCHVGTLGNTFLHHAGDMSSNMSATCRPRHFMSVFWRVWPTCRHICQLRPGRHPCLKRYDGGRPGKESPSSSAVCSASGDVPSPEPASPTSPSGWHHFWGIISIHVAVVALASLNLFVQVKEVGEDLVQKFYDNILTCGYGPRIHTRSLHPRCPRPACSTRRISPHVFMGPGGVPLAIIT